MSKLELRAPQARLPRPRQPQVAFAGAWVAMLAFCAAAWIVALALIL